MWRLSLLDIRTVFIVFLAIVVSVMSFHLITSSAAQQQTFGFENEGIQGETNSGQILVDISQLTPAQRLALIPIKPTYRWVNVYGLFNTMDGDPIPVGAIVQAFDSQGTVIGATIVKHPGRYGLMPLYMDLQTTQEDEGAVPGDATTFTIDGIEAEVIGPDEPVWVQNGDLLELNLVAVAS